MVIAFGKSTEFQEKPRIYKSACEAYKDAPWVLLDRHWVIRSNEFEVLLNTVKGARANGPR